MKRILLCLLTVVCCMTTIPFFASAETIQVSANDTQVINSYTEYYDDGSYAEVTVTKDVTDTGMSVMATSYSVTGSKSYTWYDSNGVALWKFTVHGSFTFTPGVSSTCNSASHNAYSYDGAWSCSSASSYASGNKAIGNATFKRKILFVTVDTRNIEVILTCNNNGDLY